MWRAPAAVDHQLTNMARTRILVKFLLALAALLLPQSGAAQSAHHYVPGLVRVRILTSDGPIILALDARHAPKTTANFLAYVDDGRFDDTLFYRAARRRLDPKLGFIQGGVGTDARRTLPPIPHEPTDLTGIHHLDATISMARGGKPGSAMGNFFITVGVTSHMDARPGYAGYAAFGRVVAGMDTVRRILAEPTGGGSEEMKGQMILKPVRLITARRLDGVAKPTSPVKPWLLGLRRQDLQRNCRARNTC
jgi:peptidyl-prolyl cis-trans isomerase A (cyclophilin A)